MEEAIHYTTNPSTKWFVESSGEGFYPIMVGLLANRWIPLKNLKKTRLKNFQGTFCKWGFFLQLETHMFQEKSVGAPKNMEPGIATEQIPVFVWL